MAWQASGAAQPPRLTAESAPSNAENESRNPVVPAAVVASSGSAREVLPLRLSDRARRHYISPRKVRNSAEPTVGPTALPLPTRVCSRQVVGRVPSPQPSRASSPSKPIRLAVANNASPSKRLATGTLSPNRSAQCTPNERTRTHAAEHFTGRGRLGPWFPRHLRTVLRRVRGSVRTASPSAVLCTQPFCSFCPRTCEPTWSRTCEPTWLALF